MIRMSPGLPLPSGHMAAAISGCCSSCKARQPTAGWCVLTSVSCSAQRLHTHPAQRRRLCFAGLEQAGHTQLPAVSLCRTLEGSLAHMNRTHPAGRPDERELSWEATPCRLVEHSAKMKLHDSQRLMDDSILQRLSLEGSNVKFEPDPDSACPQHSSLHVRRLRAEAVPSHSLRLLAHPDGRNAMHDVRHTLWQHAEQHPLKRSVLLAIGPEGGWLEPELELLRSQGFRQFSVLQGRTLDTHTAVSVICGLLLESCFSRQQ